jgi:hypothetical protein
MSFKIPAIGGISMLAILAVINVVVGNSLFVTSVRSLLGGVIVFGLFIGIQYVFKNILEIDFSSIKDNGSAKKDQSDRPDVEAELSGLQQEPAIDITIDDDDSENVGAFVPDQGTAGNTANGDETVDETNQDSETDTSDSPEVTSTAVDEESLEETVAVEELKTSPTADGGVNFADSSADVLPDINDLGLENIDSMGSAGSSVDEIESVEDTGDYTPAPGVSKSVEETLGFDASFEDMAKAIRTKLKKDD